MKTLAEKAFFLPKLSNSLKLRVFHIFNHLALAFGFIYEFNLPWILAGLFSWMIIGSLGVSIGFHRLLSHRSFKASKFTMNLLSTLGCFATGGPPISWAGFHRLHHSQTDTKKDPHSPKIIGKLSTYFHLWDVQHIPRKYVEDFLKDSYLIFLQRNYYKILSIWCVGLYFIDYRAGIYLYSFPAVLAFHIFGLINTFCHNTEEEEQIDSSKDNFFVNLLSWGEGWHSNHHRFPYSYRIGLKPGQYDLSAFLVENVPGIAIDQKQIKKQRKYYESKI